MAAANRDASDITDPASPQIASAPSGILEQIALQMASSLNLNDVLTTITQGLVEELEAAFARI